MPDNTANLRLATLVIAGWGALVASDIPVPPEGKAAVLQAIEAAGGLEQVLPFLHNSTTQLLAQQAGNG